MVGHVERGGKVLTFAAESTDAETLHQIIDNNCSNEAIIVTDSYKSYIGLGKKYNHVVVKQEDGGYVLTLTLPTAKACSGLELSPMPGAQNRKGYL